MLLGPISNMRGAVVHVSEKVNENQKIPGQTPSPGNKNFFKKSHQQHRQEKNLTNYLCGKMFLTNLIFIFVHFFRFGDLNIKRDAEVFIYPGWASKSISIGPLRIRGPLNINPAELKKAKNATWRISDKIFLCFKLGCFY